MTETALLVGNSDGIGLAFTRLLLDKGWRVLGVSRSPTSVDHPSCTHVVHDVKAGDLETALERLVSAHAVPDVLVYCAGIGEELDPKTFEHDEEVFAVNLAGLVRTAACIVPAMVARGSGHLIGLSSIADELVIAEAPSYSASKAGFSSYLNGLGLLLRKRGVSVTNVRFGFVDTKMARAETRPLLITPERAAAVLWRCVRRRPLQCTYPRTAGCLARVLRWVQRVGIWAR